MSVELAPVVSIDGPTASGKGAVASRLALRLGFHYLDSGAIYRVLALTVLRAGLDPDVASDQDDITGLAADLPLAFQAQNVFLGQQNVSECIRTERVGNMASRLAVLPAVRNNLLQRQRDFRKAPGLVADGRDMGAVVFPDSRLKVFLTASPQTRAARRVQQLTERGVPADYGQVLQDLQSRDSRDAQRAVAPLAPCPGARLLDSSALGIDEVVQMVHDWYITA